MRLIYGKYLLLMLALYCCKTSELSNKIAKSKQYVTVLGIAQDGGYPHINNSSEFNALRSNQLDKKLVVSLGLVDFNLKKKWLFEATPDMPQQLYDLELSSFKTETIVDGVFLTHAHIGHYTGLMHFGREAMGAKEINVFAMPRMKKFLESNQPWKQLVDLSNIKIIGIEHDKILELGNNLSVKPVLVPHRDELSETVGYIITGKEKSLLFIPDINKWKLWDRDIVDEVEQVDYALLDATFFKDGEIPRPMSEVPHPFITETVELFRNASKETKGKIFFIHFNHSNPAISKNSKEKDSIKQLGFNFAEEGMNFFID